MRSVFTAAYSIYSLRYDMNFKNHCQRERLLPSVCQIGGEMRVDAAADGLQLTTAGSIESPVEQPQASASGCRVCLQSRSSLSARQFRTGGPQKVSIWRTMYVKG